MTYRTIRPNTPVYPAHWRKGQASILMLLAIFPLVALAAFVANMNIAIQRTEEVQTIADAAAMSAATIYARGLNAIESNNAKISLSVGQEIAAKAIADSIRDARIAVGAQAAAACAACFKGSLNLCDDCWELAVDEYELIWGDFSDIKDWAERKYKEAKKATGIRLAANKTLANVFPIAAEAAAVSYARQNGSDEVAVVPNGLRLTYPMKRKRVRDLCSTFRDGSPSNAGKSHVRVYNKMWNWPKGVGTSWAMLFGAWPVGPGDPAMMAKWMKMANPKKWEHHLSYGTWQGMFWLQFEDEKSDRCRDNRTGVYLHQGTLKPDAGKAVDALRFTVVTLRDNQKVFDVPNMLTGEETLKDPSKWGLSAFSQVELVNSVSIDGTTGQWKARLRPVTGELGITARLLVAESLPSVLLTGGKGTRFRALAKAMGADPAFHLNGFSH